MEQNKMRVQTTSPKDCAQLVEEAIKLEVQSGAPCKSSKDISLLSGSFLRTNWQKKSLVLLCLAMITSIVCVIFIVAFVGNFELQEVDGSTSGSMVSDKIGNDINLGQNYKKTKAISPEPSAHLVPTNKKVHIRRDYVIAMSPRPSPEEERDCGYDMLKVLIIVICVAIVSIPILLLCQYCDNGKE